MPAYLPRELRAEWDAAFEHLRAAGAFHPNIDPPLLEAWVSNIYRLRTAQKAIEIDGPFPDGRAHPAHVVVATATTGLATLARAFGVTGVARTVTMLAGVDAAAKEASETGGWAAAAAVPAIASTSTRKPTARKAAAK
jgi:phage terminase small subunit